MKILFISRAYPPVIGGIETHNYELARALSRHSDLTIIANTHGKRALPLFLPWALITALIKMRHYDALLLGDGVLGIVGAIVKTFYGPKKRVACVVHGLDLTFKNTAYQEFWVKQMIPEADRLIAVGRHTITEGVRRGIPQEKFVFIPNGVAVEKFPLGTPDRARLAAILKRDLTEDTRVLLTAGRLVKRKGVAWFIRNVLPTLPQNVIYAIAGDGPDRDNIHTAIADANMHDRVIMLGRVSDEDRLTLFHSCDLFIQPNIPVDGDMEGFGIVVLEAGSAGIPVIAAALEGLKDAITHGKNGLLVPTQDADAWRKQITTCLADDFDRMAFGRAAHAYIAQNNDWNVIAQRYRDAIAAS